MTVTSLSSLIAVPTTSVGHRTELNQRWIVFLGKNAHSGVEIGRFKGTLIDCDHPGSIGLLVGIAYLDASKFGVNEPMTIAVDMKLKGHAVSFLSLGPDQTTDAVGTALHETMFRGRSEVTLYNNKRPHSRLGWMSLTTFAAARRAATLCSADGSAPRLPPPQRVDTKPPLEPLMLSLLGTIIGNNDGVALFMEKNSPEVVRLRTGESHQEWVLRSVQGRQAMLEKGDRQETVTLPTPADTAAGATAPGVPAMPGMTVAPDNGRRSNRR
jgi:hypothetical protein